MKINDEYNAGKEIKNYYPKSIGGKTQAGKITRIFTIFISCWNKQIQQLTANHSRTLLSLSVCLKNLRLYNKKLRLNCSKHKKKAFHLQKSGKRKYLTASEKRMLEQKEQQSSNFKPIPILQPQQYRPVLQTPPIVFRRCNRNNILVSLHTRLF